MRYHDKIQHKASAAVVVVGIAGSPGPDCTDYRRSGSIADAPEDRFKPIREGFILLRAGSIRFAAAWSQGGMKGEELGTINRTGRTGYGRVTRA